MVVRFGQHKDTLTTLQPYTTIIYAQIISWDSLSIQQILRNPPPPYWKGFPTTKQQEQAGRRRDWSRAERETADLMMNYMITCYASELFVQVENHLQSRQRRRPSPLFPSPPHPSLPTLVLRPSSPFLISHSQHHHHHHQNRCLL